MSGSHSKDPADDLSSLKPSGVIPITKADAEMMIDLMDNPPPPNERLQEAFKKYKATVKSE